MVTRLTWKPAFDWWVTTVLQRCNRIIKRAVNWHHHISYKFGIPLPSSVADAECLDRINGKTLWMDALCKEMEAVRIAFEVQDASITHIPGYKKIPGHVVWDVKMDFTQKARYVAGGHHIDPPKSITYSSVISHESVQIALFLAALNDMDVCLTDIGNAYLTAPTMEKCYVVAGDEFGPELKGWLLKTIQALYGLKSTSATFHAHLALILHHIMGFTPCEADPDV